MKLWKLFLLFFLFLEASGARAQTDSSFVDKIQTMKKKKLIEKLNLSKEKTDAFIKIYDDYVSEERRFNKEKQALFQKLVHMSALGDAVSDDKITETIDQLDQIEHKILSHREATLDQMKGSLTAPQRARFIVFEQNFQFRLRQMWFDIQHRKNKMKKFMPPPPLEDEDLD